MAGTVGTARSRSVHGRSTAAAALRGRLVLACAIALAAIGIVCSSALAYRFNEPAITQTGPEETVFDWGDNTTGAPTGGPRSRCSDDDIPDMAARAFRDANGKLVLISSHFTTRRFIGDSFDGLTHPCAVVMPSGLNRSAAAFDDHEWLSSPYTLDGTNVYALVSEEYQGWRSGYGYNCVGDWTQQQKCWRNSVVLARSTDGGATFTSPGSVVASSPYRFASGIGPYGYFKPSNIVQHTDGFFYAVVRTVGTDSTPAQPDGVCVMRTSDLTNPTSWRAWDGSGFNISFINPYTQAGSPADHACPPVDPDLYGMTSTLVYSTYLQKYLLVDHLNGGGSYNPNPADKVPGIYFSTSKDLLSWTPPKLLMEAEIAETFTCGDADPVRVPSLIDHASPARNFETIGQHAYLYFTRSNMVYNGDGSCYLGLDRDLVRIPIEFLKPLSPTLTSTSPPSPANNNAPRVRGSAPAGTTVKVYTNAACNGTPVASAVAGTFATSGILVSVPDDSTTSFYARSADSAGNDSDCSPAPVTYVEDSTRPNPPTLAAISPVSPANNNSPRVRGSAEAGSAVRLYTNADCTGSPVASVVASTFATSGILVSVADDSTTLFSATATDPAGNASICSSSLAYVEDSTPPAAPDVTASDPPSPANKNQPRILGAAAAGAMVKLFANGTCAGSPVASGSAATFVSPGFTVSVPDDSTTLFSATATDPAGNASSCSGSLAYVEDSTLPAAPEVTASDPPSPANENQPRILGTAPAGTMVKLFANGTCTGSPVASGSAATFVSPGFTVSVPDDSSMSFYATATDSTGNTSACSSSYVTFVEVSAAGSPPEPPGIDPPPSIASNATTTPFLLDDTALPDLVAPRVILESTTINVSRRGVIRLRLSCPDSEPRGCSGTVSLRTLDKVSIAKRKRKLKLGARSFRVGGGDTAAVGLKLTRKGRLLVQRTREVSAVATIIGRDEAGNSLTRTEKLILEAARRKRNL